jgi:RNA 2',3'-cyclic 3'-phosphodiesterase
VSAPLRRLFFAFWPASEPRRALTAAARAGLGTAGRAVPEANLHVTLAFLGNVAEQYLETLDAIAANVAACGVAGASPLTLDFDRLEHWARPQIIVAVGAAPLPLGAQALAAELKRATQGAGFSPDLKPFHAHVTLARKVAHAPDAPLTRRVSWSFDTFALVDSRSDKGAVSYSVLRSYVLVDAHNQHVQASK